MPQAVGLAQVWAAAARVLQGEHQGAVVQLGTEQGVEEGEGAFVRRGAGAERRGACRDVGPQGLGALRDQRFDQADAVAEPAEERALADPGRRRDVVHGHLAVAALGEQAVGGGEHRLAVAGGVGPLLAYGGHGSS